MAQEYRTVMYSIESNGHVAVHHFPFNANDKSGMEKLQKFVDRGFTFEDPRKPASPRGEPEVLVTKVVDAGKPEIVSEEVAEVGERVQEDSVKQKGDDVDLLIPCPECDRKFKSFFGLSVHRRTHESGRKSRKKMKGLKRVKVS